MNCKVKKVQALAANAPDDFSLPSKGLHDFCLANYDYFRDPAIINAANIVMFGYLSQEKVQAKFIRIISFLINRFSV